MTVKPIIFSAPMVRALLEGRKTQTRRVMKVQPDSCIQELHVGKYHPTKIDREGMEYPGDEIFGAFCDWGEFALKSPYAPRDLLWVREGLERARGESVGYPSNCAWLPNTPWTWKKDTLPAMFMPRWASRLTLRVTNIRAERLHDISEEDARAEGANFYDGDPDEYGMCRSLRIEAKDDFRHIWEDLYHKDSPKAWHRNPWVWAYEFEVIRKNVDAVMAANE